MLRQAIAAWCVAICLVLCVVSHAQAEDILEPNFKATTDDECIREKECVKWAFDYAVRQVAIEEDKEPYIQKWLGDINLVPLGDDETLYQNQMEMIFAKVAPYFPHDIKFTHKGVTGIFLVSDDFERDVFHTYRDVYLKLFQEKILMSFKLDLSLFAEAKCLVSPISGISAKDKGEIFATALMMVPVENKVGTCISGRIFSGLGFPGSNLYKQPYLTLEQDSITSLHQFLIFLLYQPEIKMGSSIDEALKIVDDIYPRVLQDFNAMRDR